MFSGMEEIGWEANEAPVREICGIEGKSNTNSLQSWPTKFVLGCGISPLRQQAESRNLEMTFLANSVVNPTQVLDHQSHPVEEREDAGGRGENCQR